jgi:hypothetical protein
MRVRVLSGLEMPSEVPAFRVHQCPGAQARTPPATGPACQGCGLPMDADLAAGGDETHPSCDPDPDWQLYVVSRRRRSRRR